MAKKKRAKAHQEVSVVPDGGPSCGDSEGPVASVPEGKKIISSAKTDALLGRPWWQGVAGIAQIGAALVAILSAYLMYRTEVQSDKLRREAARPVWMVSGYHQTETEHGKGFRIGLINAGGATVIVRDIGFRKGVKGCWVVQPAYPYAVPVGSSTEATVTCSDGAEFGGDILLAASTQAGEITVHRIWVSVITNVDPAFIVGGGVSGEANLIEAIAAVENATYLRPAGNLPP